MASDPMQEKTAKVRITVRHCKAARGLLDWTAAQLAEKSGVAVNTIHRWENHVHSPRQTTRDAIQKAFEEAGIEFSNGTAPGVKLYLEGKHEKPSAH